MGKRTRKKNFPQKKYMFYDEKKYSFKWIFGSSHFVLALFAAIGVFIVPMFLASFFGNSVLVSLFIYLIIQLGLALDYYFDRHIDEKFLFFFYFFSIVALFIFLVFGLY